MRRQNRIESITVQLVTQAYQVVGDVRAIRPRLSDLLNAQGEQYLELYDAEIARHQGGRQASEGEERRLLQIAKSAIAFAIPRGGEPRSDALSQQEGPKPFEYVDKERYEAHFSLPVFDIKGYLHLRKLIDVRKALVSMSMRSNFVPITEAEVVYIPDTQLRWENDVIIVNWDAVEIFWLPGAGDEEEEL